MKKNAVNILVNMGGRGGKESIIEKILGTHAEHNDNRKPEAEPMKNAAIVLVNMSGK